MECREDQRLTFKLEPRRFVVPEAPMALRPAKGKMG